MQNVLEDHTVALQETFSTRWLSFRGAVDALRKSYVPLIATLVDRSGDGCTCATARGLLKAVKKPSFLLATYFLSDSLAVLAMLSQFFQKATLNIGDVGPMVVLTRESMQAMKHQPGHWLQELEGKRDVETGMVELTSTGTEEEMSVNIEIPPNVLADFNPSKVQFLQAVCDDLGAQFSQIDIVDAFAVFDPRNLPSAGTLSWMRTAPQSFSDWQNTLLSWTPALMASPPSMLRTLPSSGCFFGRS